MLGLTVLETGKFDSNFIMPICLPTSDKFKDDDRGKFKCRQLCPGLVSAKIGLL